MPLLEKLLVEPPDIRLHPNEYRGSSPEVCWNYLDDGCGGETDEYVELNSCDLRRCSPI